MKYNIGDKVRVINYGHYLFSYDKVNDKFLGNDMLSNIVGKEGVIFSSHTTQNREQYEVTGVPNKRAWYDEDQLELIQ